MNDESTSPDRDERSVDGPDATSDDITDDHHPDCPLCRDDGGEVLFRTPRWRVVLVHDPQFPGFTRVIWHDHRREMTDLSPVERDELMHAVFQVEALMIQVLAPDKVNLASLGNQVDHVHWHIIPRWRSDSHFPSPIWAAPIPGRSAVVVLEPERLGAWRRALTGLSGAAELLEPTGPD